MAMTKRDKKKFIREHMNFIRDQLLAHVDTMPAEFDNVELRQMAADHVNAANWTSHHLRGQTLRGKAYRTYRANR